MEEKTVVVNIDNTEAAKVDIRQALVDLSNNDQLIILDLQQSIIDLSKTINRLEFLARIFESVMISKEEKVLKTISEEQYKSLCSSIISQMLEEKNTATPLTGQEVKIEPEA